MMVALDFWRYFLLIQLHWLYTEYYLLFYIFLGLNAEEIVLEENIKLKKSILGKIKEKLMGLMLIRVIYWRKILLKIRRVIKMMNNQNKEMKKQ